MRLEDQIGPNEQILWSGTKDKKVSFWESIFNPMMPFALLWGLIDFTIIGGAMSSMRDADVGVSQMGFLVPFFLIHLLPVWLYLGGVLTSVRKAKNTRYCVTDQAVYIQSGMFDTKVERKDYSHVLSLTVGQSFWDKRSGTGDVRITLDEVYYSGKHHTRHQRTFNIENIADYEDVFQLVQQNYNAYTYNASSLPRSMNPGYPPVPPYGNPQVPQYGNPQVPQYGNPQVPQYGNPQVPQYGNPQVPQYGNPQVPQYGNPQVPQYGNPQVPQYGNPQVPQYGNPQVPQYGNPQVPQYGNPQMQQPVGAEMASLDLPPVQDDFKDPTLSAFDFQQNDAFGSGNDDLGNGF